MSSIGLNSELNFTDSNNNQIKLIFGSDKLLHYQIYDTNSNSWSASKLVRDPSFLAGITGSSGDNENVVVAASILYENLTASNWNPIIENEVIKTLESNTNGGSIENIVVSDGSLVLDFDVIYPVSNTATTDSTAFITKINNETELNNIFTQNTVLASANFNQAKANPAKPTTVIIKNINASLISFLSTEVSSNNFVNTIKTSGQFDSLYLNYLSEPFAIDGYYPLYTTEAKAKLYSQKVSNTQTANKHGLNQSSGPTNGWTTIQKDIMLYMPDKPINQLYSTLTAEQQAQMIDATAIYSFNESNSSLDGTSNSFWDLSNNAIGKTFSGNSLSSSWGSNGFSLIAKVNPQTVGTIFDFDGDIKSEFLLINEEIPPKLYTGLKNNYAFVAIDSNNKSYMWGGGDAQAGTSNHTQENVKFICNNWDTYAFLKNDGTVTAIGLADKGGSVPSGLTGVDMIFATEHAYCALKSDKTVVCWGDSARGGSAPSGLTDVAFISASNNAFCALKTDGSIVAWGHADYGGSTDNSKSVYPVVTTDIKRIYANASGFLAISNSNQVYLWGRAQYSGDYGPPSSLTQSMFNADIKEIYTSLYDHGFGVLMTNNRLVVFSFRYANLKTLNGSYTSYNSDHLIVAENIKKMASDSLLSDKNQPNNFSGRDVYFNAWISNDGLLSIVGDGGMPKLISELPANNYWVDIWQTRLSLIGLALNRNVYSIYMWGHDDTTFQSSRKIAIENLLNLDSTKTQLAHKLLTLNGSGIHNTIVGQGVDTSSLDINQINNIVIKIIADSNSSWDNSEQRLFEFQPNSGGEFIIDLERNGSNRNIKVNDQLISGSEHPLSFFSNYIGSKIACTITFSFELGSSTAFVKVKLENYNNGSYSNPYETNEIQVSNLDYRSIFNGTWKFQEDIKIWTSYDFIDISLNKILINNNGKYIKAMVTTNQSAAAVIGTPNSTLNSVVVFGKPNTGYLDDSAVQAINGNSNGDYLENIKYVFGIGYDFAFVLQNNQIKSSGTYTIHPDVVNRTDMKYVFGSGDIITQDVLTDITSPDYISNLSIYKNYIKLVDDNSSSLLTDKVRSNLLIGKSKDNTNYLTGSVSDITIWNKGINGITAQEYRPEQPKYLSTYTQPDLTFSKITNKTFNSSSLISPNLINVKFYGIGNKLLHLNSKIIR